MSLPLAGYRTYQETMQRRDVLIVLTKAAPGMATCDAMQLSDCIDLDCIDALSRRLGSVGIGQT